MGDDECVEVCVGERSDMERRCATVAGVCVCVCVCLSVCLSVCMCVSVCLFECACACPCLQTCAAPKANQKPPHQRHVSTRGRLHHMVRIPNRCGVRTHDRACVQHIPHNAHARRHQDAVADACAVAEGAKEKASAHPTD